MKFTLTVDLSNAAFEDNYRELDDILIDLMPRIRDAYSLNANVLGELTRGVELRIRDTNGNTVGLAKLSS